MTKRTRALDLDKEFKKKKEEEKIVSKEREIIFGWIWLAWTEVLNDSSIRKEIISVYCNDPSLYIGPTIEEFENYSQVGRILRTEITNAISQGKTSAIFTIPTLADENGELHYNNLYLHFGKPMRAIILDPSYPLGPYDVTKIHHYPIKDELEELGITKFGYPEIEETCQIDVDDVFCQTWSLFMTAEYVCKGKESLGFRFHGNDKKTIQERYQVLHDFILQVIQIKSVQTKLDKIYKKGSRGYDSIRNYPQIRNENAVNWILHSTPEDLYPPRSDRKW